MTVEDELRLFDIAIKPTITTSTTAPTTIQVQLSARDGRVRLGDRGRASGSAAAVVGGRGRSTGRAGAGAAGTTAGRRPAGRSAAAVPAGGLGERERRRERQEHHEREHREANEIADDSSSSACRGTNRLGIPARIGRIGRNLRRVRHRRDVGYRAGVLIFCVHRAGDVPERGRTQTRPDLSNQPRRPDV